MNLSIKKFKLFIDQINSALKWTCHCLKVKLLNKIFH